MGEETERSSKKVIYERVGESTTKNNVPIMVIVAVIVLGILAYIFFTLQ